MHALIIEQDSWTIFMIEDVLRELGYSSFVVASSRSAAVAAASVRCPDLIVSDSRLQTSSGIEAVRQICTSRRVPVVFVTAAPQELDHCGLVAEIVAKPFGAAALREGVVRATAIAG